MMSNAALIPCLNAKTIRLAGIESIAFEFEFYIFWSVTPVVFGLKTKAGITVGVTNRIQQPTFNL